MYVCLIGEISDSDRSDRTSDDGIDDDWLFDVLLFYSCSIV